MRFEKKTWPEMFQLVLDGQKNFDMRLADFPIQVGDTLVLKEWDPQTKSYTGREISKVAKYVLRTKELNFWKQADIDNLGYQVISF